MDAGELLCEVGELVVLRHAEVGDDEDEVRVATQHLTHRSRAGVGAADGRRAGMDDDGHAGGLEPRPRRVEPVVVRGEVTDLDVHLEEAGPVVEGRRHLVTDAGLG